MSPRKRAGGPPGPPVTQGPAHRTPRLSPPSYISVLQNCPREFGGETHERAASHGCQPFLSSELRAPLQDKVTEDSSSTMPGGPLLSLCRATHFPDSQLREPGRSRQVAGPFFILTK